MKVAVQLAYKSDRKEPFSILVRRIIAAFDEVGHQAFVTAYFSDSQVPVGVSAVGRA